MLKQQEQDVNKKEIPIPEKTILDLVNCTKNVETIIDGIEGIPDYTGYHKTLEYKLRQMGFGPDDYKLDPFVRIGMEVLTSFFLYPIQNEIANNKAKFLEIIKELDEKDIKKLEKN